MNLHTMRAALLGLSAYRPLLHEPVMVQLKQFLNCIVSSQGEYALDAYAEVFYALRQEGYLGLGPPALSGIPLLPAGGAGRRRSRSGELRPA